MLPRLRKRQRPQSDGGYSLAELLVSMMIFSIVMGITFTLLIVMTNQTKDTLARVQTLQQAKLGISQIDRQVRSGNVILDPADEKWDWSHADPYFSMRIYTQAGSEPRCAQWRVKDHDGDTFGNLEYRSWKPGPSDVTEWSVVARNLVKMDFTGGVPTADDPENWPPFWVDSEDVAGTQAQYVRVTLRLKNPSEREDTLATSVTTVITGRNTVFGYPATICDNVPTPD